MGSMVKELTGMGDMHPIHNLYLGHSRMTSSIVQPAVIIYDMPAMV
jgi:hypothetical protein